MQGRYRRVKTPTLIQMDALECGAACLGIILGYYGRQVPLEELRVACGVTRDGSNALNIVKAAHTYGLEAKGYRQEMEQLLETPLPFIVYWGFNHFIVIEGFSKKYVYINDPGCGRLKITYHELDLSFTGIVLAFERGPHFQKSRRRFWGMHPLLHRLRGVKSELALLTFIGLCLTVPQLMLAGFFQVFIDYLLEGQVLWWKGYFLGGMVATSGLIFLLTLIKQNVLSRLYLKLSLLFSTQFFWHSLSLPLSFFAQRFNGEIASRMALNNDVAYALVEVLINGLLSLVIALTFGLSMFYYDTVIAAFTIWVVLINTLFFYFLYHSHQESYASLQQTTAKSTAYGLGALYSLDAIKATSNQSKFFSRWAGLYTGVLNHLTRVGKRDAWAGVAPLFFENLTTIMLLMVGSWRVMEGHLTVGMLLALQILMNNFTAPILTLLGLMQSLHFLRVDSNRLDDVLNHRLDPYLNQPLNGLRCRDEPAEQSCSLQAQPATCKLKGYLEVKDLSFGFNPQAPPLLKGIHFQLAPGKSLAIVGPSGCGKSTLAQVVAGLFQPWTGEILWDGLPKERWNRATLAASIAMVWQDRILFSETIQNNIALLDPFPIQADLIQATQDACIHEEIMQRSGGYELLLGKGGNNLSVGQQQRLEIARALYRHPSLLILDEATSALDPAVEAQVMRHIRRRGCACLIIAHRLSTIKHCDEILVLSGGSVVQQGTHHELLQSPGLYRTLVQMEEMHTPNLPG